MPMRTPRLFAGLSLAAIALAIAGGAHWFGSQTSAVSVVEAPAAPVNAGLSAKTATAAAGLVLDLSADSDSSASGTERGLRVYQAVLAGDGPFAERLAAASATYGAHHYRVRRAVMYARSLCASPDPSGSLVLPLPDPSRDWALEALAELCVGMDAIEIDESIPMVGEPEALFRIERTLGRDAAIAAAEDLLAGETDPVLLEEAALFAWEVGRAPSPSTMGVNPEAVGPTHHMSAISDAVKLAACRRPGDCGPNDWQTLAFCTRVGCAPGASLPQALSAHYGEQQMRLIYGYARWIGSFRSG